MLNLLEYKFKKICNDIICSISLYNDYLNINRLIKNSKSIKLLNWETISQWILFSLQAWHIHHDNCGMD